MLSLHLILALSLFFFNFSPRVDARNLLVETKDSDIEGKIYRVSQKKGGIRKLGPKSKIFVRKKFLERKQNIFLKIFTKIIYYCYFGHSEQLISLFPLFFGTPCI